MTPDTSRAAARKAFTIPCAGSSNTSSCSSTQLSGPRHFLESHQQGTPLGHLLPGIYIFNDGQEYVVSSTGTSSSTNRPNLPAAPGSLRPLRDSLLSLLNASSTPLERQLAIYTYLSIGEEAMRQVLQAEEAAATVHECYAAKAGLTSRPQAWEARKLLAQFSKGKEAMATTIATTLETLANGRNTRLGLDLCAVPEQLQPFAVGLLHKAGACSAYALPVYQQQLPLAGWLSQQQYTHLLSHHSGAQLCYDFQPTYWDTAVEAVPHPFPLFAPGRLAKALLAVPPASLLRHCCLPGMPSLAAAAEQLGLAPAGATAAAAKAAASASSGMGMLRRIWCSQLLRLRPGVMLRLLAARALLRLQPAVPLLAGSACSSEVAASSGQGGGGAGSAPTAVGADEEGSKAAEAAAVLPPSRRQQGGSRQRIIGRQLRLLGGLVGRALLLRVC
ncbi:hypothetical protein OEZ86_006755 [Tetradesmus obliquus]|nr:hypothetical protein OEZ86_006755 [Tetradesmus obliquus]